MRKFGYARVSTNQQSLETQIEELKKQGVIETRILSDVGSRDNLKREGIELLKIKVEKGDKIYITRLDRLGSNVVQMSELIDHFSEKGVYLEFIKESLSTKGPMGQMLIMIMTAIAKAEKARILERTNEGRATAFKNGVKFGRPRAIDREKLLDLAKDHKASDIAKILNIGRSTVYAILKEEREKDTEIESK